MLIKAAAGAGDSKIIGLLTYFSSFVLFLLSYPANLSIAEQSFIFLFFRQYPQRAYERICKPGLKALHSRASYDTPHNLVSIHAKVSPDHPLYIFNAYDGLDLLV